MSVSEIPSVHLAPMAGITDPAMRAVSYRFGADVCYTGLVSSIGLDYESRQTFQLLEKLPEEGPLVAHIYGADPESMGRTASMLTNTEKYSGIDINCGCPVPKVLKSGAGAALMKSPHLVEKIVKAVAANTNLPVSLKTRVGLNPQNVTIYDIARAAENGGASSLTVHGRFASNVHKGDPEIDLLAAAVDCVKIPVIVNGGIKTASDAVSLLNAANAAGVMIGRGAIGNPWLFKETKYAFSGNTDTSKTAVKRDYKEVLKVLREHIDLSIKFKEYICRAYPDSHAMYSDPEFAVMLDFRLFMFNYFKGMPGSSALRREMNNYKTVDDIIKAAEDFLNTKYTELSDDETL